jgi:hypothetical protein
VRTLRRIGDRLARVALWPVRRLRRRLRRGGGAGARRVLVPFTGGSLDETVLAAAIRIAHADGATLVPAYLILVPMQRNLDVPSGSDVSKALPFLEAVEHAASRAGVPVDARVETGRSPIHTLRRLWGAERFDLILVPAPAVRGQGFTPKELLWMLANAPAETLILRPEPPAPTKAARAPARAGAAPRRATPAERVEALPPAVVH